MFKPSLHNTLKSEAKSFYNQYDFEVYFITMRNYPEPEYLLIIWFALWITTALNYTKSFEGLGKGPAYFAQSAQQ